MRYIDFKAKRLLQKSFDLNIKAPFFMAFLSIGVMGCGHMKTAIHSNWMEESNPKIAVFPLVGDDVFSGPRFGQGVADALVTELVNKGYPVMERSHLNRVMEEHKLQYGGGVDSASLSELGKLSGVNYIVYGSLTTRETMSAFEYFLGNGVGEVQIDTVRIKWVDIKTGQILASSIVKNPRGGTPEKIANRIMKSLTDRIQTLAQDLNNNAEKIGKSQSQQTAYVVSLGR